MVTRLAELEQIGEIEVGGETEINDDVVASISGVAAREVEGVSSLGTSSIRRTIAERVGGTDERARGVAVEAGRREAILDIDLRVIYGFSIPETVGQGPAITSPTGYWNSVVCWPRRST